LCEDHAEAILDETAVKILDVYAKLGDDDVVPLSTYMRKKSSVAADPQPKREAKKKEEDNLPPGYVYVPLGIKISHSPPDSRMRSLFFIVSVTMLGLIVAYCYAILSSASA